jgi:hypothetical protein
MIQSNVLTCNGGGQGSPHLVSISGTSATNSITIRASNVVVELHDVSAQISVESGAVQLLFSGSNFFTGAKGGVLCLGGANLTFAALSPGFLQAGDTTSSFAGAGIGGAQGATCGSLLFLNGTYIARSVLGAGIGRSEEHTTELQSHSSIS